MQQYYCVRCLNKFTAVVPIQFHVTGGVVAVGDRVDGPRVVGVL